MPSTACIIQHKLGVPTTAACFDLNAACSGFIYALDTACAMLTSGRYKKGPRDRCGEARRPSSGQLAGTAARASFLGTAPAPAVVGAQ